MRNLPFVTGASTLAAAGKAVVAAAAKNAAKGADLAQRSAHEPAQGFDASLRKAVAPQKSVTGAKGTGTEEHAGDLRGTGQLHSAGELQTAGELHSTGQLHSAVELHSDAAIAAELSLILLQGLPLTAAVNAVATADQSALAQAAPTGQAVVAAVGTTTLSAVTTAHTTSESTYGVPESVVMAAQTASAPGFGETAGQSGAVVGPAVPDIEVASVAAAPPIDGSRPFVDGDVAAVRTPSPAGTVPANLSTVTPMPTPATADTATVSVSQATPATQAMPGTLGMPSTQAMADAMGASFRIGAAPMTPVKSSDVAVLDPETLTRAATALPSVPTQVASKVASLGLAPEDLAAGSATAASEQSWATRANSAPVEAVTTLSAAGSGLRDRDVTTAGPEAADPVRSESNGQQASAQQTNAQPTGAHQTSAQQTGAVTTSQPPTHHVVATAQPTAAMHQSPVTHPGSALPGGHPLPHTQVAAAMAPLLQRADGTHSVRIDLTPEHLGAVQVHLELRGGEVVVSLQAADTAARDLLHDNLDHLRQQLEASGLRANVDLGSGSGTHHQFAEAPRSTRGATLPAGDLEGEHDVVPAPATDAALDLKL